LVLDLSRMLPGAITARMLADLGARVVKVEAPRVGDPMRLAFPRVGGTGAAFCALYRGTESVCLDLRQTSDAAALCSLAGHADVILESFRPGTLEAWGAGPQTLLSKHPGLTICSLSSFGTEGPDSARVAHDVNLVASSGLLSLLPGEGLPGIQIADVAAGLLATSAILATLLGRASSGRGGWIDQPLSTGPLPFLTMALAEHAAGGGGMADTLLSGACPAYRLYDCGDGKRLAVGALEPKFWTKFVELLDLPELSGAGLNPGPAGRQAAQQVQQTLAAEPRDHWLALFENHGLPVSPVLGLGEATPGEMSGLMEKTPAPGGASLSAPGPFLPSLGVTPAEPAPGLGEHTSAVLGEFGLTE
jgi:crotonobetainyl-CoA:carnitine CoA-transferase CaiB-like acyl-CoA transferase